MSILSIHQFYGEREKKKRNIVAIQFPENFISAGSSPIGVMIRFFQERIYSGQVIKSFYFIFLREQFEKYLLVLITVLFS